MREPAQGAELKSGPGARQRLGSWVIRHLQVFFYSLGQIWRGPFGALMTSAVIGIALALPAGLYLLLENAQVLSGGWDASAQVSVFLLADLPDERARASAREIEALPEVASARYVSRAQALREFEALSGFGEALKALGSNPLPAVVVLRPAPGHSDPAAVRSLVERLGTRPEVDIAQYDQQWVMRLYAIMEIVKRAVLVLASLLALAVLLIVGNTIRLGIQNRRDEIEIAKLFGATSAFIRRPFLYTGLWYGLIGAGLAWALVSASFGLLHQPAESLAALYNSSFRLQGLDLQSSLVLVATGAGLGLIGSWVAVGRHLGAIEPS